jgi:hypothetical protein
MSDQTQQTERVDLALAVPNEQDVEAFLGITKYAELGAKAMTPDKLFDFVEHIAIQNGVAGINCQVRFEIACAYVKQNSLWVHRRENNTQKYPSYEAWYKEVKAMVTGQSERSIQDWLRNQRFLESADIDVMERAEMLQEPSRVHSLMSLFETDGLGRIIGFATDKNPNLIDAIRQEIGDATGEVPLDQLPAEVIGYGLANKGETPHNFANRLLNEGRWNFRITFADDSKGGGPRLVLVVWKGGTGKREEYAARFDQDVVFSSEARDFLDKHRNHGR